jgi:hypothetical protein
VPGTPAAQHSSEDHRSQSVRVADIGPQLRRKLAPGPVALMLALTACAAGGDADQGEGAPSPEAEESQPTSVGEVSTEMTDPGGRVVGHATFTDTTHWWPCRRSRICSTATGRR